MATPKLKAACVWCNKYDSEKACRLCREGFPESILALPHEGWRYDNEKSNYESTSDSKNFVRFNMIWKDRMVYMYRTR